MTGSGNDGGLLTHLEKLIGRKCFWTICMLHTNELPLRHLIANLDGPTNSKNGFKGPIGKLLSKVNKLKRLEKFEPIRH